MARMASIGDRYSTKPYDKFFLFSLLRLIRTSTKLPKGWKATLRSSSLQNNDKSPKNRPNVEGLDMMKTISWDNEKFKAESILLLVYAILSLEVTAK